MTGLCSIYYRCCITASMVSDSIPPIRNPGLSATWKLKNDVKESFLNFVKHQIVEHIGKWNNSSSSIKQIFLWSLPAKNWKTISAASFVQVYTSWRRHVQPRIPSTFLNKIFVSMPSLPCTESTTKTSFSILHRLNRLSSLTIFVFVLIITVSSTNASGGSSSFSIPKSFVTNGVTTASTSTTAKIL